jgi:hypothetical protein
MNGAIVHCPVETRHFLTVETKEGGVIRSVLANLNGSPIQSKGLTYAGDDPDHVEVYLDTLTGEHVVKVSHSQAIALRNEGTQVYQGVGGVHGWFVDAPDFTLAGRHGGKSKPEKVKEEETEYGGPAPGASANHNPGNGDSPLKIAAPKKRVKKGR